MDILWKASAIVILTVILSVTLSKAEKDISLVLNASASCMVAVLAVRSLTDVFDFLRQLGNAQYYPVPFTDILLKIVGAALISELTGLICADAGSTSLEKAMHFLGNAMILSMALPIFEVFIDIIQEILNIA